MSLAIGRNEVLTEIVIVLKIAISGVNLKGRSNAGYKTLPSVTSVYAGANQPVQNIDNSGPH
jgi:hypothetical protein